MEVGGYTERPGHGDQVSRIGEVLLGAGDVVDAVVGGGAVHVHEGRAGPRWERYGVEAGLFVDDPATRRSRWDRLRGEHIDLAVLRIDLDDRAGLVHARGA